MVEKSVISELWYLTSRIVKEPLVSDILSNIFGD